MWNTKEDHEKCGMFQRRSAVQWFVLVTYSYWQDPPGCTLVSLMTGYKIEAILSALNSTRNCAGTDYLPGYRQLSTWKLFISRRRSKVCYPSYIKFDLFFFACINCVIPQHNLAQEVKFGHCKSLQIIV